MPACGAAARRSSTGTASSPTTSLPTATPPTRAPSRWSSRSPARPAWSARRLAAFLTTGGHRVIRLVRASRASERRAAVESGRARAPTCWRASTPWCTWPVRRSRVGSPRAQGGDPRQPHRADPPARRGGGRPSTTARARSSAPRRSAIYGFDRGDALLCEDSVRGDGFLADVVADWEAATTPPPTPGCAWSPCAPGSCRPRRVARCGCCGRCSGRARRQAGQRQAVAVVDRPRRPARRLLPRPVRHPADRRRSTRSGLSRCATSTTRRRWPACCTGRRCCPVPSLGPRLLLGGAGRPRTRRGRSAGGADEADRAGPPVPARQRRGCVGASARTRLTGHARSESRAPGRGSAPRRSVGEFCLCAERNSSWVRPTLATSPSRSSASHSSSRSRSTSGWNCSASARPSTKACDALAVLAISVAPGGSVHAVEVPLEPGAAGDQALVVACHVVPADLRASSTGRPSRRTPEPAADRRSTRRAVGTPASAASRIICISAPTQVWRSASSYTGHRAPSGTITS